MKEMKMPASARFKFQRKHKINLIFGLLFLGAILIASPTARFWLRSILEYPVHYTEYKNFDIRIPGEYEVHGIDVSRWQRKIDWKRVKNMQVGAVNFDFTFIKATEGTWMVDPHFKSNWENSRKNGLIRGAYHFFIPHLNAEHQAKHFIRTVKLKSGDLPPVVDIEETFGMSAAQIRKGTKQFMDLLEAHYKIKPILYTNRAFYKKYFADEPEFKPYILWIAHYHVDELTLPDASTWHFWQHSDRGRVNGIQEKVDFNVFSGDSARLLSICLP